MFSRVRCLGLRRAALVAAPAAAALGASQLSKCDSALALRAEQPATAVAHRTPASDALPWWKSALNSVYKNPFSTIFGVSAPLYAAVFYRESTNPATAHMLLSQRLIHTRVFGQGIAIMSTVAVMSFVEYMNAHGGRYQTEAEAQAALQLRRGYSVSAENYGRLKRTESEKLEGAGDDGAEEYGLKAAALLPLVAVPAIPLTFYLLRGRVSGATLDRLLAGMVLFTLAHAGYVQFSDSSMHGA